LTLGADVRTLSFETSLGLTHLSSVVTLAPFVGDAIGCAGSGSGAGLGAAGSFLIGLRRDAPQRTQNLRVGLLAFPHLQTLMENHSFPIWLSPI
jgi:hypothetical protein